MQYINELKQNLNDQEQFTIKTKSMLKNLGFFDSLGNDEDRQNITEENDDLNDKKENEKNNNQSKSEQKNVDEDSSASEAVSAGLGDELNEIEEESNEDKINYFAEDKISVTKSEYKIFTQRILRHI